MILGTQEHADAFFLKKYPDAKEEITKTLQEHLSCFVGKPISDDEVTRIVKISQEIQADLVNEIFNLNIKPEKTVDSVQLFSKYLWRPAAPYKDREKMTATEVLDEKFKVKLTPSQAWPFPVRHKE